MRREKGSGNTAYKEFYQWNSIIADVACLLTSFTTNARVLNLRNTIVVVAERVRPFFRSFISRDAVNDVC